MGGGVGRWPMEGGQGGRWGGAPESSVGAVHCFPFLGSLKNLTNWSDLTRVGGWGRGEVAHGGALVSLLGSLKNLTTGLIWLVTRVGGWGDPWRAGKGGDGGGHVGATKDALVPLFWLPQLV